MKTPLFIIIGFIVVGLGAYIWQKNNTLPPQGVACTMEAKQCPDGSYVGRTGPNCEFAACPNNSGSPPTSNPNPTPTPSVSCAGQVAAAQASAEGKICTQVATQMACPSNSNYVYTARNGCESSYLADTGWLVTDSFDPLY